MGSVGLWLGGMWLCELFLCFLIVFTYWLWAEGFFLGSHVFTRGYSMSDLRDSMFRSGGSFCPI